MEPLDLPRYGLAIVGLLLLPGAWISFGSLGRGLAFWPTFWLGAALSPGVVVIQFYALRLLGLPFSATAWVIALANLPAWLLVSRAARRAERVPRASRVGVASVSAACALLFAVYFPSRVFAGHNWMHADVVYRLAGGAMRPEEAALAGVRLGYPWMGHVPQGLFSVVTDTSPLSSYLWPNMVWLAITLALTWGAMTALGAGAHGKVWSLILLLFGVNFVGYLLQQVLPTEFLREYPIVGDWRFTPWIRKFLRFNQQTVAAPFFSALLLLAIDRSPHVRARQRWILATLLLVGMGVVYPLLFPAACGLIGAVGVARLVRRGDARPVAPMGGIVALAVMIAIAGLATFAAEQWVTQDRATGIGIVATDLFHVKTKSMSAFVVLLPLLLGAAWTLRHRVRLRLDLMDQPLILAVTGVWCAALYVALRVPHPANEYKYIFPAASALVPLAALALGDLVDRLGRAAMPATLAGLAVLSFPAFHRGLNVKVGSWRPPAVENRGFAARLDDRERYAGATDAVRRGSPPSSIVVSNVVTMHLPTIVQRAMYAPYANVNLMGIGGEEDWLLLTVKGYSASLLEERRRVLRSLFEPETTNARRAAFALLKAQPRPVVFLIDDARPTGLAEFLGSETEAVRLHSDGQVSAWVVRASEP